MPDIYKSKTITIQKKDLFFDIDALSLTYTKANGNDVVKANAISTDSLSAMEMRVLTRLMDRRVAELRDLMRRILTTATVSNAVTNALDSGTSYSFALTVTVEVEDNTLDSIAKLMHDYIVKGTLADWYADVGAGNSESLAARARDSYDRIKELIYYKPFPAS